MSIINRPESSVLGSRKYKSGRLILVESIENGPRKSFTISPLFSFILAVRTRNRIFGAAYRKESIPRLTSCMAICAASKPVFAWGT